MTSVTLAKAQRRASMLWAPVRASLGRERAPELPWVSIVLAGSVVATALATGAYVHEVPQRLGAWAGTGWPTLRTGRWWTLGTSFLLTRDWFMASTMPICLLLALVPYERRAGHGRTLVVAFVGHVTGTVIVALAVAPFALTHVGMLVRAADNVDYGGSMAIAAGLGALVGFVGDRRLTRLACTIAIAGLVLHHQMADWGHLVALPAGYVLARVRTPHGFVRASALVVVGTALAVALVAGMH